MKNTLPDLSPAWIAAPMPRFTDKGLAAALAREGYYPSKAAAYLEVAPDVKQRVATHCAEYLENYRYPLCWQAARMPGNS